MKSKVAVIECSSYDPGEVLAAVTRGINLIGGITRLFNKNEEILLKPNLLAGDPPEKAVTTHPAVFRAVAQVFQAAGARLFYGDSPGIGKPLRAASKAGLASVAQELDIPLADFQTVEKVSYPGANLVMQLNLAAGVCGNRRIVSLPKMKTHGFTRITGAVKNQFGCVPGLIKGDFHVNMPDIYKFASVVVDITKYLSPLLYIMDGITAMEGAGPRGGEPIAMYVLLFSTDPVALDAVFCKLIDLEPEFVPFMKIAEESGLGTYHFENIEIVGDDIEKLINKNFKVTRRSADQYPKSLFPTYLKNLLSPRPVIDYEKCTNCGSCIRICPVDPRAVDWPTSSKGESRKIKKKNQNRFDKKGNPKPTHQYKRCIRCYCCQEICPHKAISIKIPLLGKLIYR